MAAGNIDAVIAQAKRDRKRLDSAAIGPFSLTAIGIASVVGAGIFVTIGEASARYAGPAVIFSFILAGLAAGVTALCYAELAAMVPAAGSTYSYAYAVFGSFLAWFIGWDLLLEYLFAASTVAVGWSGYFVSFLGSIGDQRSPRPGDAAVRGRHRDPQPAGARDRVRDLRPPLRRHPRVDEGQQRDGRAEARRASAVHRGRGLLHLEGELGAVRPRQHRRLRRLRAHRHPAGRRRRLLRLRRLRRRLDGRRRDPQAAADDPDRAARDRDHLDDPLRADRDRDDRDGPVQAAQRRRSAGPRGPGGGRLARLARVGRLGRRRDRPGGDGAGHLLRADAHLHADVLRRHAPRPARRRRRALPDARCRDAALRGRRRRGRRAAADRHPRRPRLDRHPALVHDRLRRRARPPPDPPGPRAARSASRASGSSRRSASSSPSPSWPRCR